MRSKKLLTKKQYDKQRKKYISLKDSAGTTLLIERTVVKYNPRLGRYQDDSGRMIPLSEAENRLVDQELARSKVRLMGHARLVADKVIDVVEFQNRMAQDIKLSLVRMMSLGAGGNESLTKSHYGQVGSLLKKQYKYLAGFAVDLVNGKLPTPESIIYRASLYGSAAKSAFSAAKHLSKKQESFDEAKRDLDPQSKHCDDCLTHSTNGLWKAITDVVAPGNRCKCAQRCRCRISYRKRTN